MILISQSSTAFLLTIDKVYLMLYSYKMQQLNSSLYSIMQWYAFSQADEQYSARFGGPHSVHTAAINMAVLAVPCSPVLGRILSSPNLSVL